MRRAALLAFVGGVLVVAFAGVALAAVIICSGGRCEGTNDPDEITGTDQRDRIFALAGADDVAARAGEDELNGGNGGDTLAGETQNDTYFGGRGEDLLSESAFFGSIDASNDEMNGGPVRDFIEGGQGNDILRGQEGSEHDPGDPQSVSMFGDPGNDELFGGPGEDAMEGEEDTDEHYGGRNNDFIDAAEGETPATDAPDLVDCGSGFDTAEVRPNDRVRDNCEDVTELTTIAADPGTADDEEQQQQREAFLSGRGG
jgi:Ca2+-binding RTX toxin-like protein